MSGERVRCAAADLWGDKHPAVGRWYQVIDPEGRQFDLCSGACLVEYATLGALPVGAQPCTSVSPPDRAARVGASSCALAAGVKEG